MVSSLGSLSNLISSVGSKSAKLAMLNAQLSACEEELKTVTRQRVCGPTKESDQKALSVRITAIKAQITELSDIDEPGPARAVEASDEAQKSRVQSAERARERPSLAVGSLDLAKDGHLGTHINLLA
jgi:hypothetical protein